MSTLFAVFGSRAQIWIGILVGIAASILVGKVAWRGVIPWCKRNGTRMVFAACGFLIGAAVILTCGERPGDALASLFGAFAGIVAAVGGGLWLWEIQEERTVDRVVKAIDSSLGFLIASMGSACSYARDHAPINKIREGFAELKESIRQFIEDCKIYETHLIELPVELQISHAMILRAIADVAVEIDAAEKIGYRPTYSAGIETVTVDQRIGSVVNKIGRSLPPGRCDWSVR